MTWKALAVAALAPLGVGSLKADHVCSRTFTDFVGHFDRKYKEGTDEWEKREKIFVANLKDIVEHQDKPERSYNKGVTQFADYTREEYKAILGYKGRASTSAPGLSLARERTKTVELPGEFHVTAPAGSERDLGSFVRDQGACGSCWAEAATSTLESQLQQNLTLLDTLTKASLSRGAQEGQFTTFSSQQVVSCTKNPSHCGGTGGCQGATVELAYDMVKENGIPLAFRNPYVGTDQACDQTLFKEPRLGITGYVTLPSNKRQPLLEALYESGGAVSVSVAAAEWGLYFDGVFTTKDVTINHAVTLMGYKLPAAGSNGWYKIKNSWGESWGEKGHIRVEMLEDEDRNCGMNHASHSGLACDGDPDDVWVCGSSGVLFDSVYPTGLYFRDADQ